MCAATVPLHSANPLEQEQIPRKTGLSDQFSHQRIRRDELSQGVDLLDRQARTSWSHVHELQNRIIASSIS